ncbi:threonine/serine exporter family protein [Bacillus smithii]|uniref:threonine/serine exporter family protein n=1 Tax=Bacillus smithii TaxID=1479 RepID=UPI002E1C6ECF|nr:threonine/serine exporter family protein [Bacillus smithii]
MRENGHSTLEIIEVCLLAGKIMLRSGAETYRVEDTMSRIAASCGIQNTHCFVAPTAIIFSMDGMEPTKLVRISERSTDLHKIALVNNVSRNISAGKLTIREAYALLKEMDQNEFTFPLWEQILAAAISSGCFLIMFQGKWNDFLAACIAGAIGFLFLVYVHRFIQIKFFAEFLASLMIGLSSAFFVKIGIGHQLDKIIIGSVMPLVPGLAITNALRDLMAGHLVSGLSRGAEAFLTAFAIGTGIAVVFTFL